MAMSSMVVATPVKENRDDYQFIDKVIFSPKNNGPDMRMIVAHRKNDHGARSIHFETLPERPFTRTTRIGPFTYILVLSNFSISPTTADTTAPLTYIQRQNRAVGTWCLVCGNVDLAIANGLEQSYYSGSGNDMIAMDRQQRKYAVANVAATFGKLPTEVKIRIFRHLATRDKTLAKSYWSHRGHSSTREGGDPADSLMTNVQLSCRSLYNDVSEFNYDHNEFYFPHPGNIDAFLSHLELSPAMTVRRCVPRHFGTVILDISRACNNSLFTVTAPASPVRDGDWEEHLAEFRKESLFPVWRRSARSTIESEEKETLAWGEAIERLLSDHTVGKLVFRNKYYWVDNLFSKDTPLPSLLKFKGQGRVNKVFMETPRLYWPAPRLMKKLKQTLELDPQLDDDKKKRGKKRKIAEV